MKHVILSIVVLFYAGSLFAQNLKFDTLVNVTWNGTAWQNFSRTINDYDTDCGLITTLHQNWDGLAGKWADYSISIYTYVNGKYVSEILTKVWFNNSWTNNYRQTYTYEVSFKTRSIVGQIWSFDRWSNYISTSNKYDNNGNVDSIIVQLSHKDLPFENSHLAINTYNSDRAVEQTINKNWNKATLSWDNYSKQSFVYNTHKTIDTAVTALWNYNTALWQFQSQSIYAYTGSGKLSSYVIQDWQTSQWVNRSFNTNYYDNNGFLSNLIVERWDGFDFEKFTQTSYKNNSDGSIYQHIDQFWAEAINTWANDTRETFSYSASCLLPLKLLLFTATKNNNTVNLEWQTSGETNISHFTIQRNTDGRDFTSLGDIPAQSGTGINSYAFSDDIENITADTIYYRLKIIDEDELNTYSKEVSVALSITNAGDGGFKVYPNPAKDRLFVSFNVQNGSKAELRITDISGKIIYNNTVNNQGNNITGINISSLHKGMYFVLLITGNDIQRAKFIKQ